MLWVILWVQKLCKMANILLTVKTKKCSVFYCLLKQNGKKSMSRSVVWRKKCSDVAQWHQEQATSATIYILREIGPTGFLLKEETQSKNIQVFLGDPHRCSCATFRKENDLCKHICWLLLKKFRVSQHDPGVYSFI